MTKFIKKTLHSFIPASQGIISGFGERNMKVHGIAAVVVVIGGLWLGLSQVEWLVILLMIALIWAGELVNTAVEELSNLVRDELKLGYEATRRARDVAAGAVLVRAVAVTAIGMFIFVPKILELFS